MAILKDKAYESAYSTEISKLIDKVVNREPFDYNPENDAAYQALAKQYGRLGAQAREDTLADVALNTGGVASSHAVTAAQQAQNKYNQALTDKIPSLMEVAYGRYQNELNNNMNLIGTLQGLDDSAYNRFSDQRNFDYQKDRDSIADDQWLQQFLYQQGRDQVADDQWQKQFDYTASRDQVADDQWNQQFNYQKDRDQVSDSQWQKEYDLSVRAQEYQEKYNDQQAKYQKMLESWKTLGYATKEVAKYFGVKEGTRTSDEKYAAANLALQQAELALSKQKFAYQKSQSSSKKSSKSGSKSGSVSLDGYAPSNDVQQRIERMGNYFIHATDEQKNLAFEDIINDKKLSSKDKEYIFQMFGL